MIVLHDRSDIQQRIAFLSHASSYSAMFELLQTKGMIGIVYVPDSKLSPITMFLSPVNVLIKVLLPTPVSPMTATKMSLLFRLIFEPPRWLLQPLTTGYADSNVYEIIDWIYTEYSWKVKDFLIQDVTCWNSPAVPPRNAGPNCVKNQNFEANCIQFRDAENCHAFPL